jgi:hypothetical protein
LAITTVYGVGNPYTKLVENALKMVLAVTPDPWTLVSNFFQAGPSLATYWNIANVGFRGLTIGALYYMLVLGSRASRIAGGLGVRLGAAVTRDYGRRIGAQKDRIVTYVNALIASLEHRVGAGAAIVPGGAVVPGIVDVAGINAAAVEAAGAAAAEVAAGPDNEVAANIAAANAGAAAANAGAAAANAGAAAANAGAAAANAGAAAAAAADADAVVEAEADALVDAAQINIANVAAAAGALVAVGDVAHSQAAIADSQAAVDNALAEGVPAEDVAEGNIDLLIPIVSREVSPAGSPAASQNVEMSQHTGGRRRTRRKTLKNRKNRRKQISRRRR